MSVHISSSVKFFLALDLYFVLRMERVLRKTIGWKLGIRRLFYNNLQ